MPNVAVTTAPVQLVVPHDAVIVLQNLSASAKIYIDKDDSVSSTTSFRLAAGATFQFPTAGEGAIWVVGDGSADLRILEV